MLGKAEGQKSLLEVMEQRQASMRPPPAAAVNHFQPGSIPSMNLGGKEESKSMAPKQRPGGWDLEDDLDDIVDQFDQKRPNKEVPKVPPKVLPKATVQQNGPGGVDLDELDDFLGNGATSKNHLALPDINKNRAKTHVKQDNQTIDDMWGASK
mmetsp:Transcript_26744/g.25765  ORF Transcript_26744/g.25765 Transcript_26744/m.25765 type:complete len:153 (+) Transcript_26744:2711-3169(+)